VRFSRWRETGVWERVAQALRGYADMEHLFIDSTIVRAHQHSAGAQKKRAVRKSAARAAG
jgi:transposase